MVSRVLTLCLALVLCAAMGGVVAAQTINAPDPAGAKDQDMETLRARMCDTYIPTGAAEVGAADRLAARMLQTMQPDGSWADVNYTDQSPGAWKTTAHLSHIMDMVRAYKATSGNLAGSADLKAAVLRSLDRWLELDPHNPNWWYNMIGAPQQLGPILLLMQPDLSAEQVQGGIRIMDRSNPIDAAGHNRWTGANLVWLASNTILKGLVENSPEQVSAMLKLLYDETRITPPGQEGIQPDDSFHQHGAVLYAGGYGAAFTSDTARFAYLARGTRFAMPPAQMKILLGYVLDGQQWMIRGHMWDYGAVGREICRQGKDAGGMAGAVDMLIAATDQRKPELEAFRRWLKVPPPATAGSNYAAAGVPVGNRQFWCSDYMAHERPGYFTSARMYSIRTLNTDAFINGENKKTHHIADGANFLFRTGDEYRNIFPVWDWSKIPGATVEVTGQFDPRHVQVRGTTRFDGGVSDGMYGAAAMDLARGDLKAHKAWFFFDHEYVCLGAGITCASQNPVVTTLNQCLLHGPVATSTGGLAPAGESNLDGAQWVLHDSVGYLLSAHSHAHLHVGPQTGAWSEIGIGSPKPISMDVFSLWLDHGPAPDNASYAYTVVPGADAAGMAARAAHNPAEVLANTPTLQAVRQDDLGLAGIAFWQAGTLDGGPGWRITADQPCMVLVRPAGPAAEIAVSNPMNEPGTAHLTIDRKLTGPGCAPAANGSTTIEVVLPGGWDAGKSVVVKLAAG